MSVFKSSEKSSGAVASFVQHVAMPESKSEPTVPAVKQSNKDKVESLMALLSTEEKNEVLLSNFSPEIAGVIQSEVKQKEQQLEQQYQQALTEHCDELEQKTLNLQQKNNELIESAIKTFTAHKPEFVISDNNMLLELICRSVARLTCDTWTEHNLASNVLSEEITELFKDEQPELLLSENTITAIKMLPIYNDISEVYQVKQGTNYEAEQFSIHFSSGVINTELRTRLHDFVDVLVGAK